MSRYRNIEMLKYLNIEISRRRITRGFSLIEVLVAVAVVVASLAAFLTISVFALSVSTRSRQSTAAQFLAQGGLEALRNFRDTVPWEQNDLTDLRDGLGLWNNGMVYHLLAAGSEPARWERRSGAETIDIFSRSLVLEEVRRDASGAIVAVGGTVDTGTKRVVATVTWPAGSSTGKIQWVTYLTNLQAL